MSTEESEVLQCQIIIRQTLTMSGPQLTVHLVGDRSSVVNLMGMLELAKMRILTHNCESADD